MDNGIANYALAICMAVCLGAVSLIAVCSAVLYVLDMVSEYKKRDRDRRFGEQQKLMDKLVD